MLTLDESPRDIALVVGIELDQLGIQAQIQVRFLGMFAEELRQIRTNEQTASRSVHTSSCRTAAATDMRKNGAAIGKPLHGIGRAFGKNLHEFRIADIFAALHRVVEHELHVVFNALFLLVRRAGSIHAACGELAVAPRNSHFFNHHDVLHARFLSRESCHETGRTRTHNQDVGGFRALGFGVVVLR